MSNDFIPRGKLESITMIQEEIHQRHLDRM